MNRHQVLTGAVNSGDSGYSVGSVEGIHFTAYAAGCDIVILASDFQRVQIIPGATHGNIQIRCVDCSSDTGKIAASYDHQVLIFEPTPLLHHKSTHKLDYQWYQTASLNCDGHVNTLSWNLEGTRLLVGGEGIQLWQSPEEGEIVDPSRYDVGFTLGASDNTDPEWACVWKNQTASPIHHLKFSPDGLLFASASKHDRLVKVWYENKKSVMLRGGGGFDDNEDDQLDYSFCFIAHPAPVIDFSWRRISKYMPRGTVTNVLMTWAHDNICRLWSETVLPDDGLVDVQQFDLKVLQDPKLNATRHKNRFVHKLSHIRHAMHKRRKHKKEGRSQGMRITALSSSESTHDFHKYWMQQNGLTPVLHFHLAASINPETDIPLNPTAKSSFDNGFVIHWLNNKELQFTVESERLMNDINRKTVGHEGCHDGHDESCHDGDLPPTEKKKEKKHFWNRMSSASKLSTVDSESSIGGDHQMGQMGHSQSAVSLDQWSQRTQSSGTAVAHLEESPSTQSFVNKMSAVTNIDDTFDRSIERMLKDWHNSPDILFSIHPSDGSLLVWSVDFLDEIEPGCFRQAQVTFSSRLPHVFPVGDAMSMSANVMTYSANSPLEILQHNNSNNGSEGGASSATLTPQNQSQQETTTGGQYNLLPYLYMLTKHLNGSLNLWKANFSEGTKFCTCVSVSHTSRACGHRFRTNSAASHPVLPLLITTSHHNLPVKSPSRPEETIKPKVFDPAVGLSSELILWRVDSIGPLSLAGGVTELAKINSPNIAAFDNVAWLPTLLPSSALGASCNSSSSLFVASDGVNMRLYQAVIDARGLLATDGGTDSRGHKGFMSPSSSNSSFNMLGSAYQSTGYNIVSEQSTSRPGCIIELDALEAAQHDWTSTQLLHVYQGQLVTGTTVDATRDAAFIDLRNQQSFSETFYLVVLERSADHHSYLHMWEIIVSSLQQDESMATSAADAEQEPGKPGKKDGYDSDATSDASSEPVFDHRGAGPQFNVQSSKVYGHKLSLPEGVEVLHAAAAAGHLSSSTIYPACLAPYLFATACSDGFTRFWQCKQSGTSFRWSEWKMAGQESSSLSVPGRPITVSCAFTGRVAVAYRLGAVMAAKDNPSNKYVNLYVSIYECESTGGCGWVQEDVIELKNIYIPDPKAEIDMSCILGNERKISHVISSENFFKMQLGSHHAQGYGHSPHLPSPLSSSISPNSSFAKLPHVPSIPSLSTIQSHLKNNALLQLQRFVQIHKDVSGSPYYNLYAGVKKCIAQTGNKTGVLQQKHLVQLDWAPTEDGGHVMTVAVGSKILFYSPISKELAEHSELVGSVDTPSSGHPSRPTLQRSISLSNSHSKAPTMKWLRLRSLELSTADGLPPLPMHVSWAKDGVLIVGMDNEMHVYSQWHGPASYDDVSGVSQLKGVPSSGNLKTATTSADLAAGGKMSALRISQSVPHLHRMMSSKLIEKRDRKDQLKRQQTLAKLEQQSPPLVAMLEECGLFEAVQITNPVLPQYHPKQLLELLNFGKVKRVKAILAHLMHCITPNLSTGDADMANFRPRAMSVHQVAQNKGKVQVSEETSSYVDISSIPPLPLYCLLAADNDQPIMMSADPGAVVSAEKKGGYNELFSDGYNPNDDDLDLRLSDDDDETTPNGKHNRRHSSTSGARSRFAFGRKESETFSDALTHVRLPGLNNLDQMYLMALANTVANTQTDFSDKFTDVKQTTTDVDDCGLRYVLAVGHDTYLMKTLSPSHRLQFQKSGFSFSDVIWGFHSESEEEIVNALPSFSKGEPSWEEAKTFGVGWLLTNINVLKRTVEKIAKAAFQKSKDPLDAAIFYLAMKKKMVLWGLFRSISDERMQVFFKHDFTEDRWRKAALKNAYALLGLQRFTHAAAFFLLAGSIKDAIEICINKLYDIQLAMVVAKLYSSNDLLESGLPDIVRDILYDQILGGVGNKDEDKCHPDPFLRSMAYWMCKDYRRSLSTLLRRDIGTCHEAYEKYSEQENVSVFNFYNYLRTHPLLLRQKLASLADKDGKRAAAILSGFSHAASESDKVISVSEKITPSERSLYFHTAHDHFKAGCPALALEVLSKLPQIADMSSVEEDEEEDADDKNDEDNLTNGEVPADTAGSVDWGAPVSKPQTADSFDWGAPASKPQTADAMDWGAPAASSNMDWGSSLAGPYSQMKEEEPPSFALSSDSDSEDSDEGGLVMKKIDKASDSDDEIKTEKSAIRPTDLLAPPTTNGRPDSQASSQKSEVSAELAEQPGMMFDIMAQQLKFIACLKVAMEELATLATGFEVEGGQLRYQLYIWLEKQTEVLEVLCNYCGTSEELESEPLLTSASKTPSLADADRSSDKLTITEEWQTRSGQWSSPATPLMGTRANLHEVLAADRLDFEAKQQRMARRKAWLKKNQQLLRTLLTYCSLYGASGGGLACIKMELILLLQELQLDRTQKQLLSPLPFPTTLPLLSASVAPSKTVIVDPISHLQSFIHEMLSTILSIQKAPDYTGNLHLVVTLRNLSTALSSCIYECLCDSDSIVIGKEDDDVGLEGFTNISTSVVYKDSCLMAGARRKHHTHTSSDELPTSHPSKWPGTIQLIAMLLRDRDSDAPKLSLLLCESLFAVYLSILIHALTFYETNVLYRLSVHTFSEKMWSTLFGGGVKQIVRPRVISTSESQASGPEASQMDKMRVNLVRKVQGSKASSPQPARPASKPTYQEKFVPPKMSMVNFLFSKPHMSAVPYGIDYDSDDPDDDEDNDPDPLLDEEEDNEEHIDPQSYSWCLIRLAMVKYVLHSMNSFLSLIGFEPADLPSCSPLLHSLLRNLECWESQLTVQIDTFEKPPEDYIPGLSKDVTAQGPNINKYKSMLNPDNTPFRSGQHSALPCRRLWFYLVHQEPLQPFFIKYLFGKKRKTHPVGSDMYESQKYDVKMIHKEPELIAAFCISSGTETQIAVATHKEVLELDITTLLNPPVWLDDNDSDEDMNTRNSGDFVYIPDNKKGDSLNWTSSTASMGGNSAQTGRGTTVSMKQSYADVRKMGAHPIFPHYLAGNNDGAIRIYEFGHSQPLQEPRPAGMAPRPTRLQFNAQGNKFGVTDIEGNLTLFQVGFGTNATKPYMSMNCHNKSANDFEFISSSSFLATAGHSSDGMNVGLWDTLLPPRCSLIQSFHCHEYGSTSLLYAPQHQLLVAGGKKGDVCIFDVRQRKQLHTFIVHDSSVRCMALDPCEEFFVTGSAEGDIKVWGLSQHQLIKTYPGEHSKSSMFGRNPNAGVLQLHVTNGGHLYSAGADGTLKVRMVSDEHHMSPIPSYQDFGNVNRNVTFSLQ